MINLHAYEFCRFFLEKKKSKKMSFSYLFVVEYRSFVIEMASDQINYLVLLFGNNRNKPSENERSAPFNALWEN